MNDFWSRLEEVRARNDVLEHPFYVRWTRGELSREELAIYAGEYRHAVVAIADVAGKAAAPGDADLRRHAQEERAHVELWDRFAEAVGADIRRAPAPETADCLAAWTSGADLFDRLVTLYAIESAQPAIAQVKREGLVGFYGVEPGQATSYFDLHAELDHEHAAESRKRIDAHLESADQNRLVARAEATLRGYWRLLDGVVREAA